MSYLEPTSSKVPISIPLNYCEPSTSKGKKSVILDEFYGVYCLRSRSDNPLYRNRCYVGYTVDPNRRVNQHNGGKMVGGAKKTDSRGPWDMLCIVHGFPNSVSALRFEWAWQNPHKSKRLRDLFIQKKVSKNETQFDFKLRTVCNMLNVDPWKRLALTFRWLIPECELPFPIELPKHIKIERGLVQKTRTIVPKELSSYVIIGSCTICGDRIKDLSEYMECLAETCRVQYHIKCLAELGLKQTQRLQIRLFPSISICKICKNEALWGDLVRHHRCLIALEEEKPVFDGVRMATGMVPKLIQKL